ncbi:apolipoprotein N-acyltransferase [Alteromonadaceae bacterium M269]|nr:apolipoprotein N-acyltransferase [Alteromonadaceae bacterium M269]
MNLEKTEGFQKTLLALLCSGLLSLVFLNQEQFLLTWFAFIPLLLATRRTSLLTTYLLSLLAGFCMFASATYWITDFLQLSKAQSLHTRLIWASLYWLYCGHLIAFVFVLFKLLKRFTVVHEFILFPLSVALLTHGYPMLFPMHLGESQTHFLWAIQATEFVGVLGLDTLIALVNIMFYRLILCLFHQPPKIRISLQWPWVISTTVVVAWFVIGGIRLEHWQNRMLDADSLKIGLVQPNEIPSLDKNTIQQGYSTAFPPEMEMTQRLSELGAEIVIWPEAQPKQYINDLFVRRAYRREIDDLDIGLVFQDQQQLTDPVNGRVVERFNASMMIDNTGIESGFYQKIKRIPFGEYIPLTKPGSDMHRWLLSFFGQFASELSAGDEFTSFVHDKVNIIPLICYETTFSGFVANAVASNSQHSHNDSGNVLVGLSNDGWFGSRHQSNQHILASTLRAVENRLPLIHAVNNGPSLVVSPTGEVVFQSDFQHAGGYLVDVNTSPDAKGSFYSEYPMAFVYFIFALVGYVVININITIRQKH